MTVHALTGAGFHGWCAFSFDVLGECAALSPEQWEITVHTPKGDEKKRVLRTEQIPGGVRLIPENFPFGQDFSVRGGDCHFTKADISRVRVDGDELFDRKREGDVIYRLHSPKAGGKRPLLLFLHGGGECGWDNEKQLVGTPGAVLLARKYPDLYVMAPQAPGDITKMLPDPEKTVFKNTFHSFRQMEGTGWHREYLAGVCGVIRRMIAEGLVDEKRVYVTGLSMGGGGALRALSVGAGLFAAAVAICPTMMPETFAILKTIPPQTGIWVAAAYADFTLYRHKYIVDGILALKDAGHPNAHLTLFSPEEMEKYGYADPDMPLEQKLLDNHNSWTLVYHGEYGIIDWLVNQYRA
ncbi:MAG: alpha/beta fold hydrolase [Clostridia bacterium]|nr:alpha/beta fold hydrolase [Clostridia bacterium]